MLPSSNPAPFNPADHLLPASTDTSQGGEEVVVPEKFQKIVSEIEKMSVLDLSELVKILEEKFGVSAAAPIMMGPAMAGSTGGAAVTLK